METIVKALQKTGLSRNEAKVYASLITLGSSKAGKVAKAAEIDRTSTYNSLKLLLEKGLASYVVIGKIKWFQATHPSRLLGLVKEKEEAIQEIIPHLLSEYQQKKMEENVRLFKGLRGVQTVLQDIVHEGQPNFMFGSEGQLEKFMPYFAQRFTQELKKKRISVKSLVRMGRKDVSSRHASLRRVPKNVQSNVVTNIYGNKIAIIIWSKTPEAILIENKTTAEAYRSYFNFMWEHAK